MSSEDERSRAESFQIGDKQVGIGKPCFVIAEAGVAHFGDLQKAKKLVDLAKYSGADAVKFQTFDVDALIAAESPEWKERLGGRCLKPQQFRELKAYCDEQRIIFLSTAHDEVGLEIVESLDPPAFKVGSGELGNWSFIERIARIGKPIILSTGMYSENDVESALSRIAATKNPRVAILHCVTSYPTQPSEANLKIIHRYKQRFGGVVGYSDHTQGSTAVLGAVALGAAIIEKHISLDFDLPDAQDWRVSAGPQTLAKLIQRIRKMEACLGSESKKVSTPSEIKSKNWACKSLVTRVEIKKGQKLEFNMLDSKRPGTGISPSEIERVIGREIKTDLAKDTLIKWDDLK